MVRPHQRRQWFDDPADSLNIGVALRIEDEANIGAPFPDRGD